MGAGGRMRGAGAPLGGVGTRGLSAPPGCASRGGSACCGAHTEGYSIDAWDEVTAWGLCHCIIAVPPHTNMLALDPHVHHVCPQGSGCAGATCPPYCL